jgi:hypothetical protein
MSNWPAVLAAVEARGPRCDKCSGWTFRPEYKGLPKFIARLCPICLPLGPELLKVKVLALTQVFVGDLVKYHYLDRFILNDDDRMLGS